MTYKYDTATSLKTVTPDNGANLPDGVCRALWIGGAGDVELVAENDTSSVTISSVPAGTLLLVRTKQVLETTTATDIVAMY